MPPTLAGGFFTPEPPGEPPPRSRARPSFNTSRLQGRGLCHGQWPQQPSLVGAWGVRGRVPPTSCRGHLALGRGGGLRRGLQPRCKAAPALRSFPAQGLSVHPWRCGGLWGPDPGGERTEPDPAPGAELGPSAGTRLPQGCHLMRLWGQPCSRCPGHRATAPGPGNGAPDGMQPGVRTQDSLSGGAWSQVLSLGSLTVTILRLQPRLSTRRSVSGAPGRSPSASRAAGRAWLS